MNNRLSIVVVSCDSYKDIVEQYLKYFFLNWKDCEYPVFIAMENETIDNYDVVSVAAGNDSTWTKKAIEAIRMTDSKYVLLSVDDLYISETVNNTEITKVLDFIEKENIKYYRIPVFRNTENNFKLYPGTINVEMIESNKRYNVSIGTAIWEKQEILKILGDGKMSAWDLENYFIKKAEVAEPGYLDGYVADTRYLLHSVHMIKSGKWIPTGIKEMKEKGFDIDLCNRSYISFSDQLKLNKFYSWCSKHFPTRLRILTKKIMTKMGFKFASK